MELNQSRTTRLREFITTLYPWAHGHQRKALADFVAALLAVKSCSQAALAGAFEKKKAAQKRLTRWLHNERVDPNDLAQGVALEIVAHLARHALVRLALDWTVEDDKHVLVASVIVGRRAVPLYWRVYAAGTFKHHRSRLERAFVQRLFELVLREVPRAHCLLTADRGFADVLLFALLEQLQVAYLIRVKECVKVCVDGTWRKLKTLRLRGNTRRRSLGRVRYCERAPRRLYLTQSRARTRSGQWGIWWLASNRNFTPWHATQEYARRWGCECGFRDAKHLLGLKEAQIANRQAYARMFAVVAIGLLLLALIAYAFVLTDPQATRRLRSLGLRQTVRGELSLWAAILHLLTHDVGLFDYLVVPTNLNREITLPNVS